jgi:ADP-ribose pyrophosphatase YjhB (NUDIX family)
MNQAYSYIITLEGKNIRPVRPGPRDYRLTHAGGAVYKKTWFRVKYLIVQSSKDLHQWVLPKGHIESGEDTKDTAVREVREETGVWARINEDLGDEVFNVKESKKAKANEITVHFYLMEASNKWDDKIAAVLSKILSLLKRYFPRDEWRENEPDKRGHKWLLFNEAMEKLLPESKRVLHKAEKTRQAKMSPKKLGDPVSEADEKND